MTAFPKEIWYTRCPVPTPLGIAINQGVIDRDLAELGITVRSIQDTADPDVRASHYDHHLAHSFRQGGSVPAIWARAAGADTRVIGLSWIDGEAVSIADLGVELDVVIKYRPCLVESCRELDIAVSVRIACGCNRSGHVRVAIAVDVVSIFKH